MLSALAFFKHTVKLDILKLDLKLQTVFKSPTNLLIVWLSKDSFQHHLSVVRIPFKKGISPQQNLAPVWPSIHLHASESKSLNFPPHCVEEKSRRGTRVLIKGIRDLPHQIAIVYSNCQGCQQFGGSRGCVFYFYKSMLSLKKNAPLHMRIVSLLTTSLSGSTGPAEELQNQINNKLGSAVGGIQLADTTRSSLVRYNFTQKTATEKREQRARRPTHL